MKNINKLFIWVILSSIFISCDKDNEGTLFSAGQADKATFLTRSSNWDLNNATFKVVVGRTATAGGFTVPISVTTTPANAAYTNVFGITSPAVFTDGEEYAELTLGFSDLSTINPASLSIIPNGMDVNVGLSYPFSLTIASESVAYGNISIFNVATSNNLEFEEVGEATLDSSGGWEEDVISNVKVQKAKGSEVYKIVQPFGYTSIAFMILADGVTVTCPNQIIYNHSGYGPVTMGSVKGTYDEAEKKVTLTVGAYTVSAGSFGGGTEIIYLP